MVLLEVLVAAAHNVAQVYRPAAEQAHKAAMVVVPSTAPINLTAQVAVAVLAAAVETLWPHPTAETVALA